jgi:hypothetical protein
MKLNTMQFGNLQEAWEGINEFLLVEEDKIQRDGGGVYGSEMISYNNFITVNNPWVDPEFDFGKVLGYTDKKWSSLVANYVDFHYLEMIRAEISMRRNRGAKSYNYAYHFKNKHGSGKDCLISLNFTKRTYSYYPIVTFYTRVSEVTKRLLFDFLLVQRMIEYVYGPNPEVRVEFFTSSFYITPEAVSMYNNHRPLKKILRPFIKENKLGKFQTKVLEVLEKYQTIDPEKITFRSHRRSAQQLQRDEHGEPISGRKSIKVKDFVFPKPVAYPKEIITASHVRNFLRNGDVIKEIEDKQPRQKGGYVPKTELLKQRMKELEIDPSGIKKGRGRLSIKEMEDAIANKEKTMVPVKKVKKLGIKKPLKKVAIIKKSTKKIKLKK